MMTFSLRDLAATGLRMAVPAALVARFALAGAYVGGCAAHGVKALPAGVPPGGTGG